MKILNNGKTLINADDFKFIIRPIKAGGLGVFLNHPTYSDERLLAVRHSVAECRTWIFHHFVGEKGTKFNIEVVFNDL